MRGSPVEAIHESPRGEGRGVEKNKNRKKGSYLV